MKLLYMFDVYVHVGPNDESISPESLPFASSYKHLSIIIDSKPVIMTTRSTIEISELLINVDGDYSIVVSLISKKEEDKVRC